MRITFLAIIVQALLRHVPLCWSRRTEASWDEGTKLLVCIWKDDACDGVEICMCIYASLYMCMYASLYMCMYASLYMCMYASLYMCMYASLYMCMYASLYTNTCMYVYMCVFCAAACIDSLPCSGDTVYVYVCISVHKCNIVCVCMHVYVCVCMHVYVCTYVYACMKCDRS
jgi:hypothetical protein